MWNCYDDRLLKASETHSVFSYDRVLVLEDDLRFSKYFRAQTLAILEDVDSSQLDWDLIYFGRKRLGHDHMNEAVPGHRFLTTVGYSYWTLAYALSRSGATKLVK